jgi:hypothetical protein
VVIVTVTRSDLRDEMTMATEAFALSPMSARAAQPNEQDYDAIREAFMETARGRWFLGEYAKRNRNADTRMVLDAVAKIEETLAAQRQPVVEDRLPDALVAIRRAVEDAESAAVRAFDPSAIAGSLAPIQRGVRIIKEISWRWREIGADGRICDLIDSQLAAIEGACTQIAGVDPRGELAAAFALLKDRIAETDGEAAAPAEPAATMAEVPTVAEAAMPREPSVVFTEAQHDAEAAELVEAAAASDSLATSDDVIAENVVAENVVAENVKAADIMAEEAMDAAVAAGNAVVRNDDALEAAAPAEIAAGFAEVAEDIAFDAAAEAEDDAVLARIALEMGAPDPEFDDIIEPVEMAAAATDEMAAEMAAPAVAETAPAPAAQPVATAEPDDVAAMEIESLAHLSDVIAEAAAEVTAQPEIAPPHVAAAPSATLPMPSPLPETSLGASILASGMLQKPRAANDPLAPIRRMTQAEKIAFFS